MNCFTAATNAAIERENDIAKLICLSPENKNEINDNIRNIDVKTYGLKWVYAKLSSGMSWSELKKGFLD